MFSSDPLLPGAYIAPCIYPYSANVNNFGSPPASRLSSSEHSPGLPLQKNKDLNRPGTTAIERSSPADKFPIMTQPAPNIPIPPPLPPIDDNIRLFVEERLNHHINTLNNGFVDQLNDALRPMNEQLAALQLPRAASVSASLKLRVNLPPKFTGQRSEGEGFKKSCSLYLNLCDADFESEGVAMGWILSFMSEDRAQSWRDQQLEYNSINGVWPWTSLADFWIAFDLEFTPVAEVQEAIVKL